MENTFFPHQEQISAILSNKYKDFNHFNKNNPMNELLFIICSLKTQEKSYLITYKKLKSKYPLFDSFDHVTEQDLIDVFRGSGLEYQKAKSLFLILNDMKSRKGNFSLSYLRKLPDEECERELLQLHGVGLKTARCVMMYSLNREIFPVDSHIWRITKRIGWNKSTRDYRNYSNKDVNMIQEGILRQLRYALHVNFISLGRNICTPTKPKCDSCPIRQFCLYSA